MALPGSAPQGNVDDVFAEQHPAMTVPVNGLGIGEYLRTVEAAIATIHICVMDETCPATGQKAYVTSKPASAKQLRK